MRWSLFEYHRQCVAAEVTRPWADNDVGVSVRRNRVRWVKPTVRFVLAGKQYELSRVDVLDRVSGSTSDNVRKNWVDIAGTRFPAAQALRLAIGAPNVSVRAEIGRRRDGAR